MQRSKNDQKSGNTRRTFLKETAALTVGLSVAGRAGANPVKLEALNRREFLRTSAVAGATTVLAAPASPEKTQGSLPWLVGAGMADITPPLEVGPCGGGRLSDGRYRWTPFKEVRLPLHARAVVVQKGDRRIAVVALDLIGLADEDVGGMEMFKRRVAAESGHAITPENLVLASSHAHSTPWGIGLTYLYQTQPFQKWAELLAQRIGSAIQSAAGSMRPCKLVVGCQSAPGLATYRRIVVDHCGIAQQAWWSASPRIMTNRDIVQPPSIRPTDIVIGPEGPADDSVHVAAFVDPSGRPLVVLVNATAHPLHEMSLGKISPDYPGEMSIELERRHPGLVAMFLQGAAGNVNSSGHRDGGAEARRHGQRLADVVDKALGGLRPVEGEELTLRWRTVKLAARDLKGQPVPEGITIAVGAARIGNANFLFLPGEPFIETALGVRKVFSPVEFLQVVGYAEAYIGYIPTDVAFDNGGYEPGPGPWARVGRGSEPIIRQEALKLLRAVRGSKTKNSD